jgi:iron-sulfur cluster repair protein YtfE (RIC family)
MTPTEPDPIDAVLRSDHAAITRDLAALRTDPSGAGERFTQLSADIVRHFVAEEQYLLPAVREHLDGGEQISDEEFAEHERIEKILRRLDDDDAQPVDATVDELERALDEHINRQESTLIPHLVSAVDAASLAELGEGALGAEQLAPTHPRAFVPQSATLSKLVSWVEGLVDKSLS